jgi:hypothetical protein
MTYWQLPQTRAAIAAEISRLVTGDPLLRGLVPSISQSPKPIEFADSEYFADRIALVIYRTDVLHTDLSRTPTEADRRAFHGFRTTGHIAVGRHTYPLEVVAWLEKKDPESAVFGMIDVGVMVD